jgi:hypothetical protein
MSLGSPIADFVEPHDLAARDFELCGHRRLVFDIDPRGGAAEQLCGAQSSQDDKFKSADVQWPLDHKCTSNGEDGA